MKKILSENDFKKCIKELSSFDIEKNYKISPNNCYLDETNISKNIKSVIHKNIISKFKNINEDKIGHLFCHGCSLNMIHNYTKGKNDIFASTNSIFEHPILKNYLDYYMTGDQYFCNDDLKKYADDIINNKMCHPIVTSDYIRKSSSDIKNYINLIKYKTYVFLQVGENNKYHKLHGFDDMGVLNCLQENLIPIMRFYPHKYSDNIINKGFSHPSIFALLDLLIFTGCKQIYIYGNDCGIKYFYENFIIKEERTIQKIYVQFWLNYLKSSKYKNIIFVNSKIFKSLSSNKILSN